MALCLFVNVQNVVIHLDITVRRGFSVNCDLASCLHYSVGVFPYMQDLHVILSNNVVIKYYLVYHYKMHIRDNITVNISYWMLNGYQS